MGMYHKATQPWVKSVEEYREFYNLYKEMINVEAIIYSRIVNDRKKLGGDDKIHKI